MGLIWPPLHLCTSCTSPFPAPGFPSWGAPFEKLWCWTKPPPRAMAGPLPPSGPLSPSYTPTALWHCVSTTPTCPVCFVRSSRYMQCLCSDRGTPENSTEIATQCCCECLMHLKMPYHLWRSFHSQAASKKRKQWMMTLACGAARVLKTFCVAWSVPFGHYFLVAPLVPSAVVTS